jgi:NAD(P)H-dependent FMN reductase
MALSVLGICASPRKDGNSDLLLRQALAGAESAGATTEFISLHGLAIGPCVACQACFKTGKCRFDDDFQPIYDKLVVVDRLILATPVQFMTVSSEGKALIDRCQCLWARKYVLHEPLFPGDAPDRRAMLIAVAGSSLTGMFPCMGLVMKYWIDALEFSYALNLFVNRADERGAVRERPSAMDAAWRLGAELITGKKPGARPRTVERFKPEEPAP